MLDLVTLSKQESGGQKKESVRSGPSNDSSQRASHGALLLVQAKLCRRGFF